MRTPQFALAIAKKPGGIIRHYSSRINRNYTSSLTQLLMSFQGAIAPLLELGKIEDWDGRTLKKREEEIRELVIILGGKCIAIF